MKRASVLEDVAAHLPEPLAEEALAAARAIPDHTEHAKSLCRLANHLPVGRRDYLHDEAFAVVRRIDDEWERVHGFIEISECLPPGRRDEAAENAWEILQTQQLDGLDEKDGGQIVALTRILAYLPVASMTQAVRSAVEILQGVPEDQRHRLASNLQRVLDRRMENESKKEPEAPPEAPIERKDDVPHYRQQRWLLAQSLVAQLRDHSEPLQVAELRRILKAIDSAGESADGHVLRQLVRVLPGTLRGEILDELLGAAREVRWDWKRPPVYLGIAERLSGKEQGEVLCQAIMSGGDWPGRALFERFVDKWREDGCGSDTDQLHLSTLLSGLAKQTRPSLMGKVAVIAPVVAHLCGRKVNDDLFHALRDVTRWWP